MNRNIIILQYIIVYRPYTVNIYIEQTLIVANIQYTY